MIRKLRVGDKVATNRDSIHVITEVTEHNYVYEIWRKGKLEVPAYSYPINSYHSYDKEFGQRILNLSKLERVLK